LAAAGAPDGIALSWIPSRNAAQYKVRRDGATIASAVTGSTYMDRGVKPGNVYRYAVNDSVEISMGAGLPAGWSGAALYDGTAFHVDGAAYRKMDGDGSLTARFVPQVASAFVKLGLSMGEVALTIAPGQGGQAERQNWMAGLSGKPGAVLGAPYTSDGRLMQPCWLRLERIGDRFTGSISPDGQHWTAAGETMASLQRSLLAGMTVSSGIPNVTTSVTFDHVHIEGK